MPMESAMGKADPLRRLWQERKNEVTCASLDQLTRAAGGMRRDLWFLGQDLTRMTDYGKSIVYLLDFSELYSYLWPHFSRSQYKVIIRYLLTESPFQFVLPPGALAELLRKLQEQAREKGLLYHELSNFLENPLVLEFIRLYTANPDDPPVMTRGVINQVNDKLTEAMKAFTSEDEALGRLAALFESKRIRPLSSVEGSKIVTHDQEVYRECLLRLESLRPGQEDIVNRVDAHNYAIAYALNEKLYSSADTFFLLVTSSPGTYSVFQEREWMTDPAHAAHPDTILRTSLVRHPVHLLYRSYLEPYGRNKRKVLRRAEKDLERLQGAWSNIAEYRAYRSTKAGAGRIVRLPRSKRYEKFLLRFRGFYYEMGRPVAGLLAADWAQESNRRQLRRVDSSGVGGGYSPVEGPDDKKGVPQAPEARGGVATYRSALATFDRVLQANSAQIGRIKKELDGFDRKTVGDFFSGATRIRDAERLRLRWRKNDEFGCTDVTVWQQQLLHNTEMAYLCADVYPDFVSFWWRTNADFNEFIKASRYYIREVCRRAGGLRPIDLSFGKGKEYNGVYFYAEDEVVHADADAIENLSSESLLQLCRPDLQLKFIRLGLPYADLCYDFEAIGEFPQRAGIVTHALAYPEPIADFVLWTQAGFALELEVRRRVSEICSGSYRHLGSN
jgi:hypothetical protein